MVWFILSYNACSMRAFRSVFLFCVEHIYRNPRSEVQRLLDKYHEGHYKVYNFTNEPGRTYPEHLFQGRVER